MCLHLCVDVEISGCMFMAWNRLRTLAISEHKSLSKRTFKSPMITYRIDIVEMSSIKHLQSSLRLEELFPTFVGW